MPSPRGAASVGLLFLAGAAVSLAAGDILPAVLFGAGLAFVLIAYLATYGATWLPREGGRRPD